LRSALDNEKIKQKALQDELHQEIKLEKDYGAILGSDSNTLKQWR